MARDVRIARNIELADAAVELGRCLGVTPFPVSVKTKAVIVQGFSWNGTGSGHGGWQGYSALAYNQELLGLLWCGNEVERAGGDVAIAIALPDPYGVVDIDARGVEALPVGSYDRKGLQHELERIAYQRLGIPTTAPRVLTGRGLHCYVRGDYGMLSRAVAHLRQGQKVRLAVHGHIREFDVGVELKGWGRGYVLAPPSQHYSGFCYEWLTETPTLETIPEWQPKTPEKQDRTAGTRGDQRARTPTNHTGAKADALKGLSPEVVNQITKEMLPHWKEGRRHWLALCLAGACARSGYPQELTAKLIRTIAERAGDNEVNDRLRAVETTYDQLHSGANIIGWGGLRELLGNTASTLRTLIAPEPEPTNPYPVGTEAHSAEVLRHKLHERVLFVPEWGWLVWDGQRWERDVGGVRLLALARDILPKYYADRATKTGPQEQAEAYKAAARACGTRHVENALEQLKGLLLAKQEEFDTEPYLLNCPNGVVDLRTGALLPHAPELRLTKLCPTKYVPEATSVRWNSFLEDVFLGDQEIIAYMQRALGYSITADTREQKLFICWGKGANGKTTLFETVRAVVGTDYARTIPTRVLLHDPHAHDAETTKVVLYGLRLALFSETAEGGRLNEALVKLVTGGDTISARYLYHHPFNFTPVAKLWLFTNHKPRITDDSFAMWRRVVLVPFRAVFTTDQTIDPEVRRDPVQNMKELLLQEREAILAELVRGAVKWYSAGIHEPETVRAAVEEYRRESDPVREWMEAETEQDSEAKTPVAELYESFQQWCEANGEKAMNIRSFGRRLAEMGFESCRVYEQRRYVKGYKGIRLQDTSTWEAE